MYILGNIKIKFLIISTKLRGNFTQVIIGRTDTFPSWKTNIYHRSLKQPEIDEEKQFIEQEYQVSFTICTTGI